MTKTRFSLILGIAAKDKGFLPKLKEMPTS